MPNLVPYKLSPVHDALDKLGAQWTEMDGWKIPLSFGSAETEAQKLSAAAGLCDLSFQTKTELRGRDLERLLSDLPAVGRTRADAEKCFYRLTQERELWIGAGTRGGGEGCVHATDRTSGLAHFLLAGPQAPEVVNRLASIDLRESSMPDLSCRAAPLAHVNVIIARRDRKGMRAYEILVTREYGEYVWQAVWETGIPFGMTAFGLETRRRLEE
jgi:glycine cleavage system aminomethyltransferase T